MGLTYVEATVSNEKNGKDKTISLLVDSGATYSLIPFDVWNELELKPKREIEIILADGTKIHRKVSECHFRLGNSEGHSPIILGEKGDEALLGVVTLENLGLILDPFQRTLRNMQMRLS